MSNINQTEKPTQEKKFEDLSEELQEFYDQLSIKKKGEFIKIIQTDQKAIQILDSMKENLFTMLESFDFITHWDKFLSIQSLLSLIPENSYFFNKIYASDSKKIEIYELNSKIFSSFLELLQKKEQIEFLEKKKKNNCSSSLTYDSTAEYKSPQTLIYKNCLVNYFFSLDENALKKIFAINDLVSYFEKLDYNNIIRTFVDFIANQVHMDDINAINQFAHKKEITIDDINEINQFAHKK